MSATAKSFAALRRRHEQVPVRDELRLDAISRYFPRSYSAIGKLQRTEKAKA
jgi:hypothetical protein